jgi:hypothetical protein
VLFDSIKAEIQMQKQKQASGYDGVYVITELCMANNNNKQTNKAVIVAVGSRSVM